MEPYLVCVMLLPTKNEMDDGKSPTLVVETTTVLATDQGQAVAKALKLVQPPNDNLDSRLVVRVLPFQKPVR